MVTFKNKVSRANSFDGWSLWVFLVKQRRFAVAGLVVILTLAFVNNQLLTAETATMLAGVVVAGLYSMVEFYLKEVRLQ